MSRKLPIAGYTFQMDALHKANSDLTDRWVTAFHHWNGEAGWYRVLSSRDRVGTVATANALVSLGALGAAVDPAHAISAMRCLLSRQVDQEYWTFVSNLNTIPVVDATCAVLEVLARASTHDPALAAEARSAATRSLDWLEANEVSPLGGWGITPGAPYRTYSTAIAIQVLCLHGREYKDATQRALGRLLTEVDPATGAWRDSSGQTSVAATAEAVQALLQAQTPYRRYSAEISRAVGWLVNVYQEHPDWISSPVSGAHEEVSVDIGSRTLRVEYSHAVAATALRTLVAARTYDDSVVVHSVINCVQGVNNGRWHIFAGNQYRSTPPSWMLYDISIALSAWHALVPADIDSIWLGRHRIVFHKATTPKAARLVSRHWPAICWIIFTVLIIGILRVAGVIESFGVKAIMVVVASLILNVISNLVYDLLRRL
ncbi:terpene cyclase/mutase family protein [Gordonia sp. L191]|uniref:prenyltransferase/squalene oxidase repeat-containing protein n=1 Tax=Gordonia sp. L191 TaxID=2982699 RepID=UPI0024BF259E|nr:prenyltransferase/squalene oxidase repeat-containing protein [Gordonia sp. L191]WHU46832.1 terpene cyclase/mutase family protein [Gordonia sp. L191]